MVSTDTVTPQDAARTLNRYARAYHAGAFATPGAGEVERITQAGGTVYSRDGVTFIAVTTSRETQRTDWTGRKYTIPLGTRLISYLAAEHGAKLPDLSRYGRVYAYAEDTTVTGQLTGQGREVCAVRITPASEIINCWGRPGSAHRYPAHDLATVTRLRTAVAGDLHGAVSEASQVAGWFDDYPLYCSTPDTEILTRRGWLRYTSLAASDQVLTLNHDTGVSEWQPLEAVNVFPARKQKMLRLEGKQHSSLTTLGHRWPVIKRRWLGSRGDQVLHLERQFTTSAELKRTDLIPTAAPCADLPTEAKYADAFVELVAWFWTEGYARQDGGAEISQSHAVNPAKVARIRAALTALYGPARKLTLGPRWSERTYDGRMTVFWLNRAASADLTGVAPRKVVDNEFILSLTRAQLELFLQTSVDADGTRPNRGCPVIVQRSRERLEPIHLAVVLTGRTPGYTQDKTSGMWSLMLMPRSTVNPVDAANVQGDGRATAEIVDYEGIVWCPTTANHTWLARRNGRVFFTGNSDGSWSAVSLRGFYADPSLGVKPSEMDRKWKAAHPGDLRRECRWTDLAADCPKLVDLVSRNFPQARLERVRLLRMAAPKPGKVSKLARHTDITDKAAGTADGQVMRFHVPLITSHSSVMTAWNLAGKSTAVHLAALSMYYLDARKPHAVVHGGPGDRIHLVVDVLADERCRQMVANGHEACS